MNNFLHREVAELYVFASIHGLALSLIVLFEPIYIFLFLGKSVSQTLLYFGLIPLIYAPLSPFAGKVLARLGVKHMMALSVPFIFLYYIVLWQINFAPNMIFLAAFLKIASLFFFWSAFHSDYSRFSRRGQRGKEISAYRAIITSAGALGPVIGGIIITFLGFPTLFIIVLFLLLVSLIPLFMSGEVYEEYGDSYEMAFSDAVSESSRKNALAFIGEGVSYGAFLFIWPIFVFMLSIGFKNIGGISTLALLAGIFLAFYVGRLSDRSDKQRLVKIGSVLTSLAWISQIFVSNVFSAFMAKTFYQLSLTAREIPFSALWVDIIEDHGQMSRERLVIQRELVHNIGRGGSLILFAGLFYFLPSFYPIFILAALASLLMMFFGSRN